MKTKLLFFIKFYTVFLFISVFSCDDGCGSINETRQQATEIQGNFVSYEVSEDGYSITSLTNETVFFENVAFQIGTIFQTVKTVQLKSKLMSFGFIESAYACSPIPPYTNDSILDIEIVANREFKENVPMGSNLIQYFDLVDYESFSQRINSRIETNTLFNSILELPYQMTLVLNEAPQTSEPIVFTVKLNVESELLSVFELTSNSLQITK